MTSYTTSIERLSPPIKRSARQAADEIAIAFQEVECPQLSGRLPAHLLEDPVGGLAFEPHDAKKNQHDGVLAGVGVLVARDLLARGMPDAEFLGQFALQRLPRSFARFHLATGKLP